MPKSSKRSKATTKAAGRSKEESDPMLKELFIDQLKDIYWAEKHLTKALAKMQKSATSEDLQDAFETHREQTEEHVARLETVFEQLGEKAVAKKCEGMEGLIAEGETAIEDTEEGTATRDAGLIIAAQKVEHYEIAAYGSLATLAKTLGHNDIADILGETLQEEKETDELLSELAVRESNYQASGENEDASA
jgi:ferritin-like metal-binding protein YciE